MSRPCILSWSGGKDCALALDALQQRSDYEVVSLLTTFTRDVDRVSMHGVQRELIQEQARKLRLPLDEVWIDPQCDNARYEAAMQTALSQWREKDVSVVAFGDLFLQEVRDYRDRLVEQAGMSAIYPVWKRDTTELAHEFVERGFRAVTCCVDTKRLPEEFCGRQFDISFLNDLPDSIDPCGENGEFHTLLVDAPQMDASLPIEFGKLHYDRQFVFREITLSHHQSATAGASTI
ncbi:ATP-binding region [Thalassoglobus neptunius]|uniref:ATP-binding region n=1 Tax=Thalassoglobus neptunius TaxID=1938619 RepID=A0A5C5WZD7_9PLAN|nr:adenine nucleotide alpha hydrolase [Thalassoglobus neptunius]TWT55295.1 ATP-binding region [Thalassoglobus neptunius]